MKITEINAGNYVYNKDNELCKVCVVDLRTNSVIVDNYAHDDGTFYEYAIEEIKGVPITNEILNKEFRKDDQWENAYYINDHIHIYSTAYGTFDVVGMTAAEVRKWLFAHASELPHPIRVEADVTWNHIDLRNTGEKGKVITFKG